MVQIFDSTSPDSIEPDSNVAGYDDGDYGPKDPAGWTAAGWSRFSGFKVHITVQGLLASLVADVENGDLTSLSGAQWARDKINAGLGRPTIYCSTSSFDAVKSSLLGVGLRIVIDVDWWEARYSSDGNDTLNPYSVARQYLGNIPAPTGHGIVDVSVTNGIWPLLIPAPNPIPATKELSMFVYDPTSGGFWATDANGDLYCENSAPFVEGLNQHPEYKAGAAESGGANPCIGITTFKDKNGQIGICYITSTPSGGTPYSFYRFARNGSVD